MANPKRPLCCEPECGKPKYRTESFVYPRCEVHQKAKARAVDAKKREKRGVQKKKNPDNTALFRRQNAVAQSFTTTRDNPRNARPQNNHGNGAGVQVARLPPCMPHQCRNEVVEIDMEKIRQAKLNRILRSGPGNHDTPEDVAASGWNAPENWLDGIKQRFL